MYLFLRISFPILGYGDDSCLLRCRIKFDRLDISPGEGGTAQLYNKPPTRQSVLRQPSECNIRGQNLN